MTRIATTDQDAELVQVSVRQLQLLAHIIDPDFDVYLETAGLVVAASVHEDRQDPLMDRYYVRTAHALLALGLVQLQTHDGTTYLVAADAVAAAVS